MIVSQVKRAYEMIADIRFFARPPSPEKERFDLVDRLRILVEEQTPRMEEAEIVFHFESDVAGPLEIETDAVQLHVVVAILCKNAREILRPGGGNVRLRLRRLESRIEISVEDDGPGVDEEIRPLIFCPYFSGRQAGRGLGFGLPKAWRIMQQLGGGLRHEPLENSHGARFVVELPLG